LIKSIDAAFFISHSLAKLQLTIKKKEASWHWLLRRQPEIRRIMISYLKNTYHKKRAGGVAQVVGPEFKPQCVCWGQEGWMGISSLPSDLPDCPNDYYTLGTE
jgi:hypothetical protein